MDQTKQIFSKFFYTHEPRKNSDIDIQQVRSCDSLINLYTKSLPTSNF